MSVEKEMKRTGTSTTKITTAVESLVRGNASERDQKYSPAMLESQTMQEKVSMYTSFLYDRQGVSTIQQ